jgi:hypothetical protein
MALIVTAHHSRCSSSHVSLSSHCFEAASLAASTALLLLLLLMLLMLLMLLLMLLQMLLLLMLLPLLRMSVRAAATATQPPAAAPVLTGRAKRVIAHLKPVFSD